MSRLTLKTVEIEIMLRIETNRDIIYNRYKFIDLLRFGRDLVFEIVEIETLDLDMSRQIETARLTFLCKLETCISVEIENWIIFL
jgi:hypothetical protein